eukprot:CAMPEP_0180504938 /NCGR_PEP_ID=MMETSP1036_2-20121128/47063_1 /TAXON_ID=632150 /ORGANISM="Azadinium spinosum, Strain 3D9" /LENGTH=48 /DNA_ID= /DNA_START= /DNA_END= /DNA_ORIENTATION=
MAGPKPPQASGAESNRELAHLLNLATLRAHELMVATRFGLLARALEGC